MNTSDHNTPIKLYPTKAKGKQTLGNSCYTLTPEDLAVIEESFGMTLDEYRTLTDDQPPTV